MTRGNLCAAVWVAALTLGAAAPAWAQRGSAERADPDSRSTAGWATQDELRRMAVKQGMRTLNDEAISLVEQDLTTIPEVIRHIYSG